MSDSIFNYTLPSSLSSDNHLQVETDIINKIGKTPYKEIVLDAKGTNYISSAGLRVLLSFAKKGYKISIINVSIEVNEVLEMTGFNTIINVERALREVSIEECKCIGKGQHGAVYRLAPDTIVKVYGADVSMDDIKNERELSKKAFIYGLPTAIALDIVKVGDLYGTVFELLDASSCVDYVNASQENTDDFIDKAVAVLKKLHAVTIDDADLPDMRERTFGYLEKVRKFISEEEYQKVLKVLNEIPVTNTLLHCDFHLKNQLMGHGELMLIDMDTLCIGDPIFELASIYNSYYGFGVIDKKAIEDFLGISIEKAHYLWEHISRKYYDDLNDDDYQKMCRKIECLGLLRVQHFFDKHQYSDVIDKGAVLLKESIARLED